VKLSDVIGLLDGTPSGPRRQTPADRFQAALFGAVEQAGANTRAKVRPVTVGELNVNYLRCSELSRFVERPERIERLRSLKDLTQPPPPNKVGNQLTFDVGHAVHDWLQNHYLPSLTGEFTPWGYWKCPRCEHVTPKIVKRSACECGSTRPPTYEEIEVVDHKNRLIGHPDSLLGEDAPKVIGEIKTMGTDRWEKLKGPTEDHRIQTHAYMSATGLKEVVFAYVDKGKQSLYRMVEGEFEIYGEPRVKFFHEEFDPALWAKIEGVLQTFWSIADRLPA
jgi:hypothetical protein